MLLRLAFGEPGRLPEWPKLDAVHTSTLTAAECHRTLDRRRFRDRLGEEELARRRANILGALERCETVELSSGVLARAAEPFRSPIGALDAIHLATALLLRESSEEDFAFATHDTALATAARSHGFQVLGA